MIDLKKDKDNIVDFLTNKDAHLFHPIFSHDLYHFQKNQRDSMFKLSLQAETMDDGLDLLFRLADYLLEKDYAYKVATQTRYDIINLKPAENLTALQIKEQSKKGMTIYCPIDVDVLDLCKDVEHLLKGYTGGDKVDHPTSYMHYSGAIYYRQDTDENGNYINPN